MHVIKSKNSTLHFYVFNAKTNQFNENKIFHLTLN